MPKDVMYGKTLRKSFARSTEIQDMPNLLEIQKNSYKWFLETGLKEVFKDVAAITDYTGNLETGSVVLTEVNEKAAAKDTQKKIDEYKSQLLGINRDVFETKTFTVTVDDSKNKNATTTDKGVLTSYLADVDTDEAFAGDTEAVSEDGKIFEESKHRSAPYFDLQIDGITFLSE